MEKIPRLEKLVVASGAISGLGRMFLGAGLNDNLLMYSGAALVGITVIGVGIYNEICEGFRESNKKNNVKKPENNQDYEKAGKNSCYWDFSSWR